MCKSKIQRPLMGFISATALLGLLAAWSPNVSLADCFSGAAAPINVVGPYPSFPGLIHANEVATITGVAIVNPSISCAITNLKAWVIYPDNSFQKWLDFSANGFVIQPNTAIQCPGDANCLLFTDTYVVRAADIGTGIAFTTNWPSGFVAGLTTPPTGNQVWFGALGAGVTIHSPPGGAQPPGEQPLTVLQPCVTITKNCVNECTPYGQPIAFSGTIHNCSVLQSNAPDGTLFIDSVSDDPNASLSLAPTTSTGRTYDGTLQQGESIDYSGSYQPTTNECGPFRDTITVIAHDETGFAVSNSATATCHVSTSPAITIAKNCHVEGGTSQTLNVGDSYVDDFTIQNTGNVPLQNAVIHDVDPLSGSVDIPVGSLDIAQSVTVHYTNGPITTANCGPITDSATVTADNLCPQDDGCSGPAHVTNGPVSCTLTLLCPPKICVTKGIICGPQGSPNPLCDPNQTYLKTDTGVNGATFCYRIIVSNCGIVPLDNVTVTDTQLGTLSDFPTHLDPGVSVTNTYSKSYPGAPSGATTNINVVTATGTGNGITANATDTATAIVVPISVACNTTLYSDFNLNTNGGSGCQVVLPSGTTNPVMVTLVITNSGMDDLSVQISGLPPLLDCGDDTTPLDIANPTNIPAGGSITIQGCVLVSCPGGLDLPISVQGTAIATAEVPCIYNSSGTAITTSVSQCPACVSCQQAVTCRVTGGGTLYTNTFSTNCIVVETTLYDDLADSAGLLLDHVSHGGQLGAPFSQMDCANRLNNPCIRGEWQHVRHYLSGKNGTGTQPQDVFDMSFHSANPNSSGHFDTLDCACLPCCFDGTNYIGNRPAPPGWSSLKFQVCNPDDRRICGPLPRPAPANAIIFTGIGTFTPQSSVGNGNKAKSRYVVFRVYIEDRSEPGGAHPGGQNEPVTIYCFQAWDTGVPTVKKADFSTLATAFRTCLSADSCAFLTAMSNGSLPQGSLPQSTVCGAAADVVDCGPLHDGSQQIHPSTDATCTQ